MWGSPRSFLGLLHMEIWGQRLEQEHNAAVIVTSPTVPYELEHTDGSREEIQNPSKAGHLLVRDRPAPLARARRVGLMSSTCSLHTRGAACIPRQRCA